MSVIQSEYTPIYPMCQENRPLDIVLHKKTGDQIKKGDVVATLYTKKQKDFTKQFFDCIKIKGE